MSVKEQIKLANTWGDQFSDEQIDEEIALLKRELRKWHEVRFARRADVARQDLLKAMFDGGAKLMTVADLAPKKDQP